MMRWVTIAAVLFTLAGCAPDPAGGAGRCGPSLGPPVLVFTLYFGRDIPGHGDLTEREWLAFLDEVITPNLPNGYTVLDASGAWMNPITRKTIHEGTKVLIVGLPDNADSLGPIARIRNAYQVQFRQQRVGMTVEAACGQF
jgi:Protein of unknown function (DUF3574)